MDTRAKHQKALDIARQMIPYIETIYSREGDTLPALGRAKEDAMKFILQSQQKIDEL